MTTNPGAAHGSSTGRSALSSDRGRDCPYLSGLGRTALQDAVTAYSDLLAEDLNRQALLSPSKHPELTAEHVLLAQRRVHRRLTPRGDAPAMVDWSLLAPLLVTLGSVGASILANFLHSGWQQALFGIFVVVGLVGLGQTARRHRSTRSEGGRRDDRG